MLARLREKAASKESFNMTQPEAQKTSCSRMFKKYSINKFTTQGCDNICNSNQIEEEKSIPQLNQSEEEEKQNEQKFDEEKNEKNVQGCLDNMKESNTEEFKALHFRTPLTPGNSDDRYSDYNFYGSRKMTPINWTSDDGGTSSKPNLSSMSNTDTPLMKNEASTNVSHNEDQKKDQNVKFEGSAIFKLAKYMRKTKFADLNNTEENAEKQHSMSHQINVSESPNKDLRHAADLDIGSDISDKPDLVSNAVSESPHTEQEFEEKILESQNEPLSKSETSSSFSSLDVDSQSEKTCEFPKKQGVSDSAISAFKNCIIQESNKLLESPCTSDSEALKCFDVIMEPRDKFKDSSESSSASSFGTDSQDDSMDSKIKKFEKMSISLLKNLGKLKDSENTENTIRKLEEISVSLLQNLKIKKTTADAPLESSTKLFQINNQNDVCNSAPEDLNTANGTRCTPEDCIETIKNDFVIRHYDPADDEENDVTRHDDSEEEYVSEEIERLVITEVTEDVNNEDGKNQIDKVDGIKINDDLFKNQMTGLQFKKLTDSNEIIENRVDPKINETISAGPSNQYPDINEDDFDVVIPENCDFYRFIASKVVISHLDSNK